LALSEIVLAVSDFLQELSGFFWGVFEFLVILLETILAEKFNLVELG
jgi:hypothetical protein